MRKPKTNLETNVWLSRRTWGFVKIDPVGKGGIVPWELPGDKTRVEKNIKVRERRNVIRLRPTSSQECASPIMGWEWDRKRSPQGSLISMRN